MSLISAVSAQLPRPLDELFDDEWVVFEPNTPGLWGRVEPSVDAFLQSLYFQGAFEGRTHKHARDYRDLTD